MIVRETALEGLKLIEPVIFGDARGYFLETYNREVYAQEGITEEFVQDNLSVSKQGVLRGMHFQEPNAQTKLVSVVHGAVFDVCVDVRVGSPTFAKWFGVELSEKNQKRLLVPKGFAHGFLVLSELALFAYKCSGYYDRDCELAIAWNDPEIGIEWPSRDVVLSGRDEAAPRLAEIDRARLPVWSPPIV